MNQKSITKKIFVAFASLGAFGLVLESVSRILDVFVPLPPQTWQEFRLGIPPPYRNAPYNVQEIVEEAQKVKWITAQSFGWLPRDYKGKLINIENSFRFTYFTPPQKKQNVWVFGGSTVMCLEVPDEYTLPSYLQKYLNEKTNYQLQVVNSGATTITTKHQLWRLKNTKLNPNDIVIFFCGVNDIIQSLYYKNPTGNMVEENREVLKKMTFFSKIKRITWEKYSDNSSFIRRFFKENQKTESKLEISESLKQELRKQFSKNIKDAEKTSKSYGCEFYGILQPCLFTIKRNTDYESLLKKYDWLIPADLERVFNEGYLILKDEVAKISKEGYSVYDLSCALEQRNEEIFLDFCHVNHQGNKILAEKIIYLLKEKSNILSKY